MVGHNHAVVGLISGQNHVASTLTAEDEAGTFQGRPHLAPRQPRREVYPSSTGLDLNDLPAHLFGDRVTSLEAVLDV